MQYKSIKPEYNLTRRERVLIYDFIEQAPEEPMSDLKFRGWNPFGKWKLCWVDNETISIERWDVDPWISRTSMSHQLVKVIKEKTDEPKGAGVLGFTTGEEGPEQIEIDDESTGFSEDGIKRALTGSESETGPASE